MIRVLDSAGSTLVEWGRQQQQQQSIVSNAEEKSSSASADMFPWLRERN